MIKDNKVIIAFSGGCFSGKTSTIMKIKEKLGDECIVLDEIIRKIYKNDENFSISKIRKNPEEYLELQSKIINEKIKSEINAFLSKDFNDKIILVDRALTDSFFYLTYYVDKSSFSDEIKEKYNIFLKNMIGYIENSSSIYDYVLEFSPIQNKKNEDNFRPSDIDSSKDIEHFFISLYNQKFYGNSKAKLIKIDLNENKTFENQLLENIKFPSNLYFKKFNNICKIFS